MFGYWPIPGGGGRPDAETELVGVEVRNLALSEDRDMLFGLLTT